MPTIIVKSSGGTNDPSRVTSGDSGTVIVHRTPGTPPPTPPPAPRQ